MARVAGLRMTWWKASKEEGALPCKFRQMLYNKRLEMIFWDNQSISKQELARDVCIKMQKKLPSLNPNNTAFRKQTKKK